MNATNGIRVAVNGYGVIGKRVADAVARQDDMQLAGVSDVVMVDNQAIVIPETIDAIRALTGTVATASESIAMTDRALGIGAVARALAGTGE
jgi:glyceraldehyde-3-phosphate dehydrogenase/erythrose-4-phosphate dehydrogenase